MLGGYQEAEVDFVADNPSMTLFHCHQQLHMDFGFTTLFDYVDIPTAPLRLMSGVRRELGWGIARP